MLNTQIFGFFSFPILMQNLRNLSFGNLLGRDRKEKMTNTLLLFNLEKQHQFLCLKTKKTFGSHVVTKRWCLTKETPDSYVRMTAKTHFLPIPNSSTHHWQRDIQSDLTQQATPFLGRLQWIYSRAHLHLLVWKT